MGREDAEDNGLGSAPAEQAYQTEGLNDRFYDLNFSVQKSRRYHEKLCAFYGGWRYWMKIMNVVSGSGLFVLLLADWRHTAEFFAALIALWGMIDYLAEPDKKAEKHCELRERFTELAIQIGKAAKTEDTYKKLMVARWEIERSEPPCKRLVDLQARNEECRAQDYPPEDLVPLSGTQRILGYIFTFDMQRLEQWKADRQRAAAASA